MSSIGTNRDIAQRFSASAHTYEQAASVQARGAEAIIALLPDEWAPAQVLEIGGGTGLLTRLLRNRFPAASLHVVDPSERMLALSAARVGSGNAVSFHSMDFLRFPEDQRFPLVVSNAALHWIEPIERAAAKLRRLLAPGGRFVGAIMAEGTLCELHAARAAIAPAKRPRSRLPTPKRFDHALRSQRFTIQRSQTEPVTAIYPSACAFLTALHDMGVTAGPVSHGPRLLTRGELRRLAAHYDAAYRHRLGGVTATYVIHTVVASLPIAPGR